MDVENITYKNSPCAIMLNSKIYDIYDEYN